VQGSGESSTKDVNGEQMVEVPDGKTGAEKVRERVSGEGSTSGKPDVRIVVEAMGQDFSALLATREFIVTSKKITTKARDVEIRPTR